MDRRPALLILNQMAGPLTWQFAEDFATAIGPVAILTWHPDLLANRHGHAAVSIYRSFAHNRGNYFLRVTSWVLYCVHAFCWLWAFPRSTALAVYSTPPLLLPLACLIRKLRGQRYVIIVHDIYPEVLVRLGKMSRTGWVARVWRRVNDRAYRNAQMVITLGSTMAKTVQTSVTSGEQLPAPVVISPWADTNAIRPLPKETNPFARQYCAPGKLTVMYSGNMGISHDLDMLVAAADQLRGDTRLHFLCIGAGPKWDVLACAIRDRRLSNITLLPWQNEQLFPLAVAAADVAFVSLRRDLAGLMLPSKAFSFLAAGVPLIVSAPRECELVGLVGDYAAGWHIQPGDTAAFVELLLKLVDSDLEVTRQASRRAAEMIGSRAQNSRRMVELISSAFTCRTRA